MKTITIVGAIATCIGTAYVMLDRHFPTTPPEATANSATKAAEPDTKNKEIESHIEIPQPKIDAKNSNIQIGSVTGDVNQTVNINELPEPTFKFESKSVNVPEGDYFVSKALLTIESKTSINNLYLEAKAPSVVSIEASPQRSGISMTGLTGKRDGFAFTNVPNAWGKYMIIITSKKPDRFDVIYDYE